MATNTRVNFRTTFKTDLELTGRVSKESYACSTEVALAVGSGRAKAFFRTKTAVNMKASGLLASDTGRAR